MTRRRAVASSAAHRRASDRSGDNTNRATATTSQVRPSSVIIRAIVSRSAGAASPTHQPTAWPTKTNATTQTAWDMKARAWHRTSGQSVPGASSGRRPAPASGEMARRHRGEQAAAEAEHERGEKRAGAAPAPFRGEIVERARDRVRNLRDTGDRGREKGADGGGMVPGDVAQPAPVAPGQILGAPPRLPAQPFQQDGADLPVVEPRQHVADRLPGQRVGQGERALRRVPGSGKRGLRPRGGRRGQHQRDDDRQNRRGPIDPQAHISERSRHVGTVPARRTRRRPRPPSCGFDPGPRNRPAPGFGPGARQAAALAWSHLASASRERSAPRRAMS